MMFNMEAFFVATYFVLKLFVFFSCQMAHKTFKLIQNKFFVPNNFFVIKTDLSSKKDQNTFQRNQNSDDFLLMHIKTRNLNLNNLSIINFFTKK